MMMIVIVIEKMTAIIGTEIGISMTDTNTEVGAALGTGIAGDPDPGLEMTSGKPRKLLNLVIFSLC